MQAMLHTATPQPKPTCRAFILIFVVIKIALNLLAMSKFGLQRDELLHLTLADHLAWGYIEVPPLIALLAKASLTFFGSSVFAARIFPTICSGLIVWITGLLTRELGGNYFAVAIACLALIFSPAFAASGYLFEPVVFDQLWWALSVWLLIRYQRTTNCSLIYLFGLVIGLGLLTKYTMAFFATAMLVGLLLSPQRKLLFNRHVLAAAGVSLLVFLPNLIWQFHFHLPVFRQMTLLQHEQLDSLTPLNFIAQQLVDNGMALLLWLPGLVLLFVSPAFKQFRFIGLSFLLIFIFYLIMNGKNYYLFGAYPMLFAAGAVAWQHWLRNSGPVLQAGAISLLTLPNILILPIAMPVFTLHQTTAIFRVEQKNAPVFNFVATWDDNKIHPITQNYGTMLGWDELTAKVARTWYCLTPKQRQHTQIYADNYGEASAINYYGKQYHLPSVVSLSSSFVLWAPSNLDASYIIYVDEHQGANVDKLKPGSLQCSKVGDIENPLAIESGTGIYLLVHPNPAVNRRYQQALAHKRPSS